MLQAPVLRFHHNRKILIMSGDAFVKVTTHSIKGKYLSTKAQTFKEYQSKLQNQLFNVTTVEFDPVHVI